MTEDRDSVLIVEDEAISTLYLKSMLSAHFRVVGTARSGEEAVHKAAMEAPDIILMDVRLEGPMDGIEAARLILKARAPRIFFCTAYSSDQIGDPIGKGIGEAILAKPIEPRALLALLSRSTKEKEL